MPTLLAQAHQASSEFVGDLTLPATPLALLLILTNTSGVPPEFSRPCSG